jgi:hypothetical protein
MLHRWSFTDGSLIYGCAGFAFHRIGEGGFGYKISSPAGIFTVELTATAVLACFICDTATYWRGYSIPGKVLGFGRQLEFS